MSPKKSLAIVLDIDRTVINTDLLINFILEKVQETLDLKRGRKSFNTTSLFKQYKNKVYPKKTRGVAKFEPEEFFEFIAEETNLEAEKIKSAFYNKEIYKQEIIVFSDALKFLNKIRENHPHVILGIFSEGVVKWQKEKLKLFDLNKYLTTNEEYILIFKNKLSEESQKKLSALPEGTIVVDDRLDILRRLEEEYSHLILIHIYRKKDDEEDDEVELEETISNSKIITINKLTDILDNPKLKNLVLL